MFINTILLKNLSLKIELNSMVVDSKNSAFEKCFKSACKFETKPRALQNELYVPIRDFKMRKKSKFEKYISIIIDS